MLEDEFVDVFRKARRGTKRDEAALAATTGLDPLAVAAWSRGDAVPTDAEAHALAAVLGLDPAKFADSAAVRWHPHDPLPANVRHYEQISTPHSNGYLLVSESDRTVMLVDPAGDPRTLLDAVRATGCELRYVAVTHKHADHCESIAPVIAAHPHSGILIHPLDAFAIGPLAVRATQLEDGNSVPFGTGKVVAIHTPGHTDGSTCYLHDDVLFTGDTLFAASVGGAVGDRSTYADLLENVRTKLLTLDPATAVMPGHGPTSTIDEERDHNPFFT